MTPLDLARPIVLALPSAPAAANHLGKRAVYACSAEVSRCIPYVHAYGAAMLHEFLDANRAELVSRCRDKVAARSSTPSNAADHEHGVPALIDQLVEVLRAERATGAGSAPFTSPLSIRRSAVAQGGELLRRGFSVGQVVRYYGDLCQALTELAHEQHELISVDEFQTFNRCLDNAIAEAVSEFDRQRDRVISEKGAQTLNERLGSLAHE